MILIKPNILDRWEIYHGDCSSYYHRRDPARMKQTDFPFRASQGPGFLSLGCCFIQGKQPQRPRVSEEAVYSSGGVGRGCLCAEAPIISFIYGGRKKSQPPAASSISHY